MKLIQILVILATTLQQTLIIQRTPILSDISFLQLPDGLGVPEQDHQESIGFILFEQRSPQGFRVQFKFEHRFDFGHVPCRSEMQNWAQIQLWAQIQVWVQLHACAIDWAQFDEAQCQINAKSNASAKHRCKFYTKPAWIRNVLGFGLRMWWLWSAVWWWRVISSASAFPLRERMRAHTFTVT